MTAPMGAREMTATMDALQMTATLAAFERRGPGTDAERRAARQIARDLAAAGYKVTTEPFWGRPNWALAHAWHVALALAGSLISVSHPTLGAALLGTALLSVLADGLTGVSPGRRLTPERASQNVVARTNPAPSHGTGSNPPTQLIVTAKYDVARAALIYRPALRRFAAALRRLTGPLALGWLAWLSIVIAWSLAVAVIRATGHHPSHTLGAIQLPPTVVLVLALALLLEAAAASYDDAAGDHGAGAAVAIGLAGAIAATPTTATPTTATPTTATPTTATPTTAAPPPAAPTRNLAVELVLQGAGEGQEIGMRRYLKAHRRELRDRGAIVLGIAGTGAGPPVWWRSDGRLVPIRYTRQLTQLADETAAEGEARPWRSRGGTPALPARVRARPLHAIAIGTVETSNHVDPDALDRLQKFALRLTTTIDATIDAMTDATIDAALDPEPTADEPAATPA